MLSLLRSNRSLDKNTSSLARVRFILYTRASILSPTLSHHTMTEATYNPLSGLWKPRPLQALYYGQGVVQKNLVSLLPSEKSKAFIITGSSLANKTPLVEQLENLLTSKHHAGTFSKIGQHAPVEDLDQATDLVCKNSSIDTIISLGGGSPIDSAKAISYRVNEKSGGNSKFLFHISIPTTLSAAECTQIAGFTKSDGVKTSVADPNICVNVIMYDPAYAAYTPTKLWLATGMRALDHAVETMYHRYATEMPAKAMAMQAAASLFELLPKAKSTHPQDGDLTTKLLLAAYSSLGFLGLNLKGGLGLSHSMGYALGSPYNIPHGETSCMTLGRVVKLKAELDHHDAEQIAKLLPLTGGVSNGNAEDDAKEVGSRIISLVKELGLDQGLKSRGVGEDQTDIIVERATGEKEGSLSDGVKQIVQNLYY